MREIVALRESAPPERDMSVEASREFARQITRERDAMLLDREYWSLAIRDPELRARYAERQRALREALAGALEARARHLGTPDLPMAAEDLARRSEEHTSELQSRQYLVCRLLLEKKKKKTT